MLSIVNGTIAAEYRFDVEPKQQQAASVGGTGAPEAPPAPSEVIARAEPPRATPDRPRDAADRNRAKHGETAKGQVFDFRPLFGTGTDSVDPDGSNKHRQRGDQQDAEQPGTLQLSANGQPLTPEEQQQVADLARIDTEVRAHEAAHAAVGGQFAGSASFSFTVGPDGRRYASAGEVPIDTSPGHDAQATISKMAQVKRAALAPPDPSGADRAIAAAAEANAARARTMIAAEPLALRDEALESAGETAPRGQEVRLEPGRSRIDAAATAYGASGTSATRRSGTAVDLYDCGCGGGSGTPTHAQAS